MRVRKETIVLAVAVAAGCAGQESADEQVGEVVDGVGHVCRSYDGDVTACDAHAPDCAYYFCSNECHPTGTSNALACSGCRQYDGDVTGCDANGAECAYYWCSNACLPRGTDNEVACNMPPPAGPITRKVFVLIYDPKLTGGKKLSEHMGWVPYQTQVNDAIAFFQSASDGRVSYSVAYQAEIDAFPKKVDNFTYTEAEYLSVIAGTTPPHMPDTADYYAFLNHPGLGICQKTNDGQIHELWIFGGYWFGFYESALAGSPQSPPGFWYNGPSYDGTACKRLLPVGIPGAHTFGHRAEATMTRVYGGWQQNRTAHNWDRFGLEQAHSPDFNVFGCGSVHYAPNALTNADDYDFNLTNKVWSNCDSFLDYPYLGDPSVTKKLIGCEAWGCTTDGYELWWWSHLPDKPGVGLDGRLNDWWQYVLDPNIAAMR